LEDFGGLRSIVALLSKIAVVEAAGCCELEGFCIVDKSIWDKVVLDSRRELSKRGEGKKELFGRRYQGWRVVGIVEPGRQVTVGEEVAAHDQP
jgi:hypothetical protein